MLVVSNLSLHCASERRTAGRGTAKEPVVLVLCLMLLGCSTYQGVRFNILSTEEEIRLGQQVSAEIERREELLDNPAVQAYVGEMGRRLADASPRQDVQYTFKVIDSPKNVNAFALPGGYMYVYSGLMKLCDNEAELASVMAHEIAHVAGHHHGESMTRQFGYNLVMSIILGEDAHALAVLGAELLGTAGAMHYSRGHEREADYLGMDMLFRAGYNPEAMLSFLEKMIDADSKQGGRRSLPIFASHPPTEERVQRLGSLVLQYPQPPPGVDGLYAERYGREVLEVLQK